MSMPRVVDGDATEELDTPYIIEDLGSDMLGMGPGPGPRGFSKLYNTPDSFRAGLETKDVEGDDGEPEPEVWLDSEASGPEFDR